jgi:hypothetical protein
VILSVGGEGTGKSPIDRGKLGVEVVHGHRRRGDSHRLGIGGVNRHDMRLLVPAIDAVKARGLLADIDTLWLDRAMPGR